ncbi:hypothetical protein AVDCRST_MAG94-5127 [uncultured Leptolyngbya sp.]|uniref:Uncharacterized protein n=1 Tax=uncultured Leptolyngbya sp. TaxID=332963 RepID=A0A6J4NEK6_9CYAN|nr:hypothetical protein AVDCRST_MAG94-5127 [uncultured Leptolyngbya sp.]
MRGHPKLGQLTKGLWLLAKPTWDSFEKYYSRIFLKKQHKAGKKSTNQLEETAMVVF